MTEIRLLIGSNNILFDNYITAIELSEFAVNNTFYGNTFAAGLEVRSYGAETSLWDNGTMGNYWEDYNGTDSNGDGIGDSPYVITGVRWDNDVGGYVSFVAKDNYPLMAPFEVTSVPTPSPKPELNSEPFPTTIIVASVITISVVGVGCILYFKKRKR